ncbi:MAG: 30S ribosomal protein S6 [Candidatus Eisenbacteria bacterium]
MGSLREYETVFVLHPSLEEAKVEEEIEGVRQTLVGNSSEIVDIERWGRRKLAYEVQKVGEGIYTLIRFRAEPVAVAELERRYRLRETVLRHLTVLAQGPPPEPARHEESSSEPAVAEGVHAEGQAGSEGAAAGTPAAVATTASEPAAATEPAPAASPAEPEADVTQS